MTTSQQPVDQIFSDALRQPAGKERAAFLDDACGSNIELRQRVDRLLRAHDDAASFLESPAVDSPATGDQTLTERPGTQIGPYKLLQQIGEGGMGVVFMAEQTQPIQRKVALKIIKPGMDTRQVIARFESERQALALMDHPNIAKVLDAGTTESARPYFVMELVKGMPLTEYCDKKHLTLQERLELFVPVCQAIQHAHQKGIIHRDIKPSNVLVALYDGKPVPKVIDFGVAKATGQKLTERTLFTEFGQVIGTLEYMSPEQAQLNQLDIDTRTDIYSLGVLLYELLTGTTPFDKQRLHSAAFDEMLRIIREEEPLKPSTRLSASDTLPGIAANRNIEPARLRKKIRGELDWIVMKSLEKERSRRYDTANGLALDVQRYLDDEPVVACPPSTGYRLRKFARRNKPALFMAGVVAAALVITMTALAVSTIEITAEQTVTKKALDAETHAKGELEQTLKREQTDAYFHRITLAHRELTAHIPNPGRAEELLDECPASHRNWEWHYLKRLWRVEPVVLKDETSTEINCVAFSPDGLYIAVGCRDGKIKVWDQTSRKMITLAGHQKSVFSVVFNPADSSRLASASADKTVQVWDLNTRQEVLRRPGHEAAARGVAYSVAFSPDGKWLAAASEGGTVHVWDSTTGQPIHELVGHEMMASAVAFSPDGRLLATGSWNGIVRIWDARSGQRLAVIRGHNHPIGAVTFSPDGRRLAMSSFDRLIDIWDVATQKRLRTLSGHRGIVIGLAFSPDGERLASGSEDRTVRVWEPTTGREVLLLRGHSDLCQCLRFSPDGRRIASVGREGAIRFWDATPLTGNEGEELHTLVDQQHEVWAVSISPDGTRIAASGLDPSIRIWDAANGRVVQTLTHFSGVVFDLSFSPDGRRLAAAGIDRVPPQPYVLKVWDAQTGNPVFSPIRRSREVFAAVISATDERLAFAQVDGTIELADAKTGQTIPFIGVHAPELRIAGLMLRPDGKKVASVGTDGCVKVWDVTESPAGSRSRNPVLTLHGSDDPIFSAAYSPDGARLVTGTTDGQLSLWDAESGVELRTVRGPFGGEVWRVAFVPHSPWIASAGTDCTARLWDATTLRLVKTLYGHRGPIRCMAVSGDGRFLVTGSADKTVKLWDLGKIREAIDRSKSHAAKGTH